MNVLVLLALVCFLAATIWAAIGRSWAVALLAAGAFLITLSGTSLIDG
ncbi:hypothetical protein OHA77_36250 [Streptosporangium sp. NBC_01639]|nr:hypothetical protein [Streptosporangium sp. NBC_01756]WSC87288.1 hypothetical protein OIE48_03480 [Streptosporangium sp. NBC_01756]WTD54023.1 hypothetical protein OHA77_36250 [Streptosporangium sp. NBC_01639]